MKNQTKGQVWDVLEAECGASNDWNEFSQFKALWPECREYRFMGSLGMGGKVWCSQGRVYVNCYSEDQTPERLEMIRRANERLALIFEGVSSEGTDA